MPSIDRHLLTRRHLLGAGGAALLSPCAALSSSAARADALPEPARHDVAGPKTLALTFDDGPSPLFTPGVLGVLARYGVPATFFMLGANVARYPASARQVAELGHALGNHAWSHPDLRDLPAPRVRDEIRRTQDVIGGTTGRTPTVFRAPYGRFTPTALAVCAELRLRPVSWSVDPADWSNPGVGRIVRTVLAEARTGSIVLHHDGTLSQGPYPESEGRHDRTQTVEALALYLPQLLDAGYRFTALE
ncbi:polysaccharide deacetylase family protein [Streptomyces iconiensis]|uniref:Polysaccharide deacetylase family protein n=1 Tax=Streptomyces iconiensis TaxID=1384038 RepID=A0ABT7A3M2_9ACTN|nr:polysaccharide deacetylase family protein [Streptomyces iconiensis]MDJ1135461.1 polysaccharide deacetylase family protein [Streptomyces iconiensis]